MNENINLVEILKDCPEGTKLYSPIFGEVFLYKISQVGYPISIKTLNGDIAKFNEYGMYYNEYAHAECVLFPSKDQRDWSIFKVEKPKNLDTTTYNALINNYSIVRVCCHKDHSIVHHIIEKNGNAVVNVIGNFIYGLAVSELCRCMKEGTHIMMIAEQLIKKEGWSYAELEADRDSLIEFYNKLGYSVIDEKQLLMRKIL